MKIFYITLANITIIQYQTEINLILVQLEFLKVLLLLVLGD